jgi:hypothetical protein
MLRMTAVADNALCLTPFSMAALSKTLELPAGTTADANVCED